MSIVSYHARVSEALMTALRADHELFWTLPDDAGPAEAELLFIDKDWQTLSWLLSAKAREEQKHETVQFALMRRGPDVDTLDDMAWNDAKAREASKFGVELVDTDSMPDDPLLSAIEGRGPIDPALEDLGYGGRVFVPTDVVSLAAALDRTTDADMREHFDLETMETFDVGGFRWTEESPDILETVLIPIFDRLKAFYGLAARAGQYVVVVHS